MRFRPLRLTLIAFAALGVLSVAPVAAQRATGSGASNLPKTAADAVKWLKEKGQGTGQQGLSFYLGLSSNWSADVVRVMLVSGASATKPLMTGDYALSALATSWMDRRPRRRSARCCCRPART